MNMIWAARFPRACLKTYQVQVCSQGAFGFDLIAKEMNSQDTYSFRSLFPRSEKLDQYVLEWTGQDYKSARKNEMQRRSGRSGRGYDRQRQWAT